MEHPASLSPPQPWRAAAIVAAAVATVELFVLVVIGIAFGSKLLAGEVKKVATATAPAAQTQAAPTTTAGEPGEAKQPAPAGPQLARQETSVIVLNGNGVSGAASIAADHIRSFKYRIAATDNAPRQDFSTSLVMFRPGLKPEAKRLAKDLGLKRVSPLDGLRARDLQGAHLAFIIGG